MHAQAGDQCRKAQFTRELRIFIAEESATEYIGPDRLPPVTTFIAGWMADTFADLAAVKH